jgi:xanthine dehydrogenase YagT iron-sulfur-binding subunit
MKDPGKSGPASSGDVGHSSGDSGELSRRGFLRGSGLAAAATALSTPMAEAVQQAAGPKLAGPNAVDITLTVNGQKKSLKAEPRVTLLDALRNQLDTTGAKKVCDRGTCGSCTVILDNKPVYACSVLAIDAQGKQIQTVEGLGAEHPLVKAFADNDAQQCGFCTPGFIMACTAFVDRVKKMDHPPTLDDVADGLGGNLCRCGTYVGVRASVMPAAKAAYIEKGGSSNA